jgi:Serine/threonine protein kinase
MEQDLHSAERPLQEIAAMQHLQKFLARGGYGSVGDGGGATRREDVLYSVVEDVQEQRRKRERAIQGMMEHHVMTSLDVLSDDTELYLVMPFCNGGELFDVLEERKSFPESEARFWMKQILRGIETLQKAGMCHRDMSLENILTTSDNLALIIDFGMSIRIPYVDNGSGGVGGLRQRCLIKPDRPCGKVSLVCVLQYCFMIMKPFIFQEC